jgi:transcriptional regulator with XRE-family HTH domain
MGKTAAILLDLIKKEGISYCKLSTRTGIAKSTLSRCVSGKTETMTLGNIELLARYFGVTPQYLAGWDDIPRPGV